MSSFLELSLATAAEGGNNGRASAPEGTSRGNFRGSLQQLAERAQYITGASGIAIALREPGGTHMVCEASSGRAAPEVGARLHVESGITAECVRTRKILRCDHASSDSRVNVESCRALGIESVLVIPLTVGDFVVGIVELFGEEAAAFQERDVTTLEHVGEMVQQLVMLRMQASVGNNDSRLGIKANHAATGNLAGAGGVAEEGANAHQGTPLPEFLTRLSEEGEARHSWHWGTWLRQGRR